ncbi:hypothetical protein [Evtepia gabavorous]|uniref:hypothetical protein n=1 Tax=Evtepia gabavorous TaxID=2211183 RepID=UPI00399A8A00
MENAKTSRPSVCNATEVCLVHRDIAPDFLPQLWDRLVVRRQETASPGGAPAGPQGHGGAG